MDCAVEPTCPYSAKKIYLGYIKAGHTAWPVDALAEEVSEESITKALESGPYGRCVYECDNDVVDNQVVNMSFEGGKTANFLMTAFTGMAGRRTRIFGTRGEIYGDGSRIEHYDFLTDKKEGIGLKSSEGSILDGHGGGDKGLLDDFIAAVADGDKSRIITGPAETLESHMMVFAAEQAREEDRVVELAL